MLALFLFSASSEFARLLFPFKSLPRSCPTPFESDPRKRSVLIPLSPPPPPVPLLLSHPYLPPLLLPPRQLHRLFESSEMGEPSAYLSKKEKKEKRKALKKLLKQELKKVLTTSSVDSTSTLSPPSKPSDDPASVTSPNSISIPESTCDAPTAPAEKMAKNAHPTDDPPTRSHSSSRSASDLGSCPAPAAPAVARYPTVSSTTTPAASVPAPPGTVSAASGLVVSFTPI